MTDQYFWKKKPVRSSSPRALLGSIEKVVRRISSREIGLIKAALMSSETFDWKPRVIVVRILRLEEV